MQSALPAVRKIGEFPSQAEMFSQRFPVVDLLAADILLCGLALQGCLNRKAG